MRTRGLSRIWIETQAGGISPLILDIAKGKKMESFDIDFKKYAESAIVQYDRKCDILAANLDRLKSELKGGSREDALASLERLLHAAQEAQIELRAKKAAFKEAHGL